MLVCELESESKENFEESSMLVRGLDILGLGELSVAMVPRRKPLTRKQYNAVSMLWPTHFHEDKLWVLFCV